MVDPVRGQAVADLPDIAVPAGSSLWEMALHGIGDAPRAAPAPTTVSLVGSAHAPRWMIAAVTVLVLGFIGAVMAMGTSSAEPTTAPSASRPVPGRVPVTAAPGGQVVVTTVAPGAIPTTQPTVPGVAPAVGGTVPSPAGGTTPAVAGGTTPAAAGQCHATMATASPQDGSTDEVTVDGVPAGVAVVFDLGYVTDPTQYRVRSDSSGTASLLVSLGQPPVGRPVTVTVTAGSTSCQTAFTPAAS